GDGGGGPGWPVCSDDPTTTGSRPRWTRSSPWCHLSGLVESDVANSVLYTNFGGKDGLVVVAYLLSRRRWWWHLLEEEAGRAESPRVPAFFDVYPSDPGNSRGSDA